MGSGGIHTGIITITQANDLTFMAGDGNNAYSQLGHGGRDARGSSSGLITITQANDLTLMAGNGAEAYSQLGHGGVRADGNRSGEIDVTLAGDLTLTGVNTTRQYALVGHGDEPEAVDQNNTVAGNVSLRAGGNVTLTNAFLGHLIDNNGTYTSGNTLLGVRGDLTADANSQVFSAAPAQNGELRFYVGGLDLVDSNTLLNGVAHGGTPFPNNQGNFAFGAGPYIPAPNTNFAYYSLVDIFNYTVDATEATNIANALATGDVTLAFNLDQPNFGAEFDWDGGTQFITINSNLNYDSTNTLNLLATGDVNFNANVQNGNLTGGDINVVAGWDGSTTFDANTFLNADVTTTTLFGNNSGSVFIGNGALGTDVTVGSQSGRTNAFGHDLTLSGKIISGAGSTVTMQQTGTVSLAGSITTAGGAVTINVGENVLSTAAGTDITADSLALTASTGIGAGMAGDSTALETVVTNLAAITDSGDINIRNLGALEIGTIGGLSGVRITDADLAANSGDDNITIVTASPLTVNAAIMNADGGDIILQALTSGDVAINADVQVTGDVGGTGVDGSIVITADGGNIAINAAVTSGSGTIDIEADLDVILGAGGLVDSEVAVGSVAGGVTVTSLAGAIRSPAAAVPSDLIRGGVLTINGNLSPGASAGLLPVAANVVFSVSDTFTAEIDGNGGPGLLGGHDQLKVVGTVDLGGAALSTVGSDTVSPNSSLVIIDNDGSDAVVGTFAGLPGGSILNINGQDFTLNYDGGDGNDVVLTSADAPSLVVTTAADILDMFDGRTSLREAVLFANQSAGPDVVTFDPSLAGQTIVLTSGQMELTETGTANRTTINAPLGGITLSGDSATRVMQINTSVSATLDGLTFIDGYADQGGALVNLGDLAITNSVFRRNTADPLAGLSGGVGGAISNYGTLNVNHSLFDANEGFNGGAINSVGSFTVSTSTFVGNQSGFNGGALRLFGMTEISNSTFNDNEAVNGGGGLINQGDLTISNSTIAGNTALDGGGLQSFGGTVNATSTTIAFNEGTGSAGGIAVSAGADIMMTNVIVAGNTSPNQADISGTLNGASTNNLLNQSAAVAGLGTLAGNGGPTQTIALLPGSPAINAGTNAASPVDQRGVPRPQYGATDIGAFEFNAAVESLVVNTNVDENDGTSDPTFGNGTSLREALAYAQNSTITGFGGVGSGWTRNNGSGLDPFVHPGTTGLQDDLTITSAVNSEANSIWFNQPVNASEFAVSFTYSQSAGNSGADGFAFVLQNAGLNVVGDAGGGLGYGGIGSSAGVAFNIYNALVQGFNPVFGGSNSAAYTAPGNGVSLVNGQPVDITISVVSATATLTMSQGSNVFTTSFPFDVPAAVGGNSAFVGFTGATGGIVARQNITNFTYTAAPLPAVITFAPSLAGQTVALSDGWANAADTSALVVSGNVTIQGPATGPGVALSIDSGVNRRHFSVEQDASLTLNNLTLTGGNVSGFGGAVWNFLGSLTVNHSTFTANAANEGGAIQTWDGSPLLSITNSTFSGNTASADGGAIVAGAVSTSLANVTIVDNTSGNGSGAYAQYESAVTMTNVILSHNTDGTNVNANFKSINGGSIGPASSNNLIDIPAAQLLVGTLGNFGGPTQTVPLLPGSTAVNAGTGLGAPASDQRGVPRDATPDIGAYESLGFDFGDAPSSYPTLLVDNGAVHEARGPRLGTLRDTELDGQPGADATDDDGVMFGAIQVGVAMAGVNIDIEGAASAKVDAWVDFNRNGIWDAGEKVLSDQVVADQGVGIPQTINFSVPSNTIAGQAYARVRVSSVGGLDVTGFISDGEVEDYLVNILPVAPQVESVTINDGINPSRSKVTSLTVWFDTEVDHAALDSAFTVTNITTNTSVGTVNVAATDTAGKTTAVLTFAGTSTLAPVVATFGTTLTDGNYRLDIAAAQVKLAGGNLAAMAADYHFGGQLKAAANNDNFFRWYGDDNADGFTDFTDFADGFLPAFGSELGDTNYDVLFDANGDGMVDFDDFAFGFLPRFGTSRP